MSHPEEARMGRSSSLAPAILVFAATLPVTLSAQNRPNVAGTEAAVVSDHPLASAAGADVLRRGGNAVDAAITMAAVLAVVRPHMNGPGGDAFMLMHEASSRKTYALNGSGRAGSKATPAFFAGRKLTEVPSTGILSVSVPGAVAAWSDALQRFGTITLAQALAPAIHYAEDGFPVSERLAADFAEESRKVARDPELARIFMPGGKPPAVGTLLKQPELAATLRAIAKDGPEALYRGAVAKQIVAFMEKEGGLLTAEDLASHKSSWTEPISTDYRGFRVLAFPPNTQGVTLLEFLAAAGQFDLGALGHNTDAYLHTLVGISTLAYEDRDRYIADPEFAKVPMDRLLSKEHAKIIADSIRRSPRALAPTPERPAPNGTGDTVYLTVVDKDGNAVSYIQSLFAAFGSGRMVPGTGITLHNRGSLYSLDPSHPNIVAPHKRPFHTLSPAMVLNADGSLYMTLGSPGGDGQPQTLVQMLNNVMVFGMTPQRAVEAPRFRAYQNARVSIEPGPSDSVLTALRARGYTMNVRQPGSEFGGSQMILIHPISKARITGADARREAYAVAW
jgi:gamma-glutamyltranspeptidase / glutathione hydrolase